MNGKRWIFLNDQLKEEQIQDMMMATKTPKILAITLLNRKITANDAMKFFTKSVSSVHHPFLLKDMQTACGRIKLALESNEKIVIYGDYDVDGITSTAMLYKFLKEEGADVDYYIPNRSDEGYGINILALQKIKNSGAKLLITVDCGITASGEVEFGKTLGLDIIITDHHMCKDKIPKAYAVINPKQPGCSYPFKELAGVGVAFKLVLAMALTLGKKAMDYFNNYVEICAIGTIADVVPLIDENRIMVSAGLKKLKNTQMVGIKSLIDIAGLGERELEVSSVSFMLAPRINAAGRVGKVKMGVQLMLENDPKQAYEIAKYLDVENRERQQTEQQILNEVNEMIALDKEFDKRKVIVLAKEGWHHGVIGIVSSRLVEKYYKPTILISIEKGVGKGSGRGIKGFNLFEALNQNSDLLLKYGGHEMAAGLSVSAENIRELADKLEEYVSENLKEDDRLPCINIDAQISMVDVSQKTADVLAQSLEPFGTSNPKPVFALFGCVISDAKTMGENNRHMRLKVINSGKTLVAVGFNMGGEVINLKMGDVVDIAFNIEVNHYKGESFVQAVLKDIRKQELNYNKNYA